MKIELIPTLQIQRELYEKPRDMARFNWYIEQMIGTNAEGKPDIVVPIAMANPMGREHCLAAAQDLLAMDAEAVIAQAIDEAHVRLAHVEGEAHVALNIMDDLRGGWTHRYFNEAGLRFGSQKHRRANATHHFVVVPCWTSEPHTPASVRCETRAALYRHAWFGVHGAPKTLKEIMQLTGFASKFAAAPSPVLTGEGWGEGEMDYTREVIQPYLTSTDFAIQFACMFGDAAAREVGYEPMGLSARAGFALALDEALQSDTSPEEALHKRYT